MPPIRSATVKPHEYRDLIAAYIDANYGPRGIVVYTEVSLGKTIIGKNRQLDVLALRKADQRALGVECKYQEVQGTTDEKIPYALQDLEALWIPGCLVYAGTGWSTGVLHTLEGSRRAVHCLGFADSQVAHVGASNPASGSLQFPAPGGLASGAPSSHLAGARRVAGLDHVEVTKGWTRRAAFQALCATFSLMTSRCEAREWSEIPAKTSGRRVTAVTASPSRRRAPQAHAGQPAPPAPP